MLGWGCWCCWRGREEEGEGWVGSSERNLGSRLRFKSHPLSRVLVAVLMQCLAEEGFENNV